MELNAEAVKEWLVLCAEDTPYPDQRRALYDALALITSQEQRIKELTEENERLRGENARYEAENHAEFNKWLKLEEATKQHHAELFKEAKIAVKADTVRKFAERLCEGRVSNDPVVIATNVVEKEMLEANNERT